MRVTDFIVYSHLSLIATILAHCDPAIAKAFTPYFSHTKPLVECLKTGACHERITLTQVGSYTVKMIERQWLNDVLGLETEAEAVILDEFNQILTKQIGGWTETVETDPERIKMTPPGFSDMGTWHRPNRLSLVNTPEDFPLVVFLSSNSSVSNVSHSFIFYTINPSLEKLAEISGLITEYQATGAGTEMNVVGFYRNRNSDILFDRLTSEGQKPGKSNSDQRYSVETYKVTPSGVISIRLEDFNYLEYREQYRSRPVDGSIILTAP